MSKKNNYFDFNYMILYILIIFFIINIIYVYSTYFEKEITIKNLSNLRGKKNLMNSVIDNKNNVYKVDNSIYYGFFSSAELYSSLEENTKYKIKGYGLRIPFLLMFPNIISAEKIN
jgi:hypothetical protein